MTRVLLQALGTPSYLATAQIVTPSGARIFRAWRYDQPHGWRELRGAFLAALDVRVDEHGHTARVDDGGRLASFAVLRGWRAVEVYRRIGDPFADERAGEISDAEFEHLEAIDTKRHDDAERRREFSGVDNDRGDR